MRFIIIILCILHTVLTYSQNVYQERLIPGISDIDIEGGYNVHLIQGFEEKIVIETDQPKFLDAIDITNNSGSVIIRSRGIDGGGNYKVALYVYFKNLDQIKARLFSNSMDTYTELNLDKLTLDINGAVNLNIFINCSDLTLKMNEIRSVYLQGYINGNADIEISSIKKFYAVSLQVETLTITCSEVKEAIVWVNKDINITASGAGSLTYKGNPAEGDMNITPPFIINKK